MKISSTQTFRIKSRDKLAVILLLVLASILYGMPYYDHVLKFPSDDSSLADTSKTINNPLFDSLYRATVANAQTLYLSKKYEVALVEFQKAQQMKPNEKSFKETIEKLKTLIIQQKAQDQEYNKLLNSGDNYFKAKDYLNAKSTYQQAIDLKPDDKTARDKLKQTMDILRSQKAQNILYDVTVANAEKMFQSKQYEKAKAEFEKASKILPEDKFAKERINTIIKIMVDEQANTENYNRSIAAADKFYNAKSIQNALNEYQKASSYKPDEKYPQDRITELTAIVKAQKARDEAYKKSISAADLLFQNSSYPEARKEYQNALTIKPGEIYPLNRIKQIDEIMTGKLLTDTEYDRLVSMGDSLYIEKKFIGAKANYQQALKIKPEEAYPKEMIRKADNQVVNQEANQKAIDEAYQAAIDGADKLFAEKSYERAKAEYQNAINIKPGEKYAKDKVAEIDGILAAAEKQKSLDDQYNSTIAGAERFFTEKSYEPSKGEFEKASKLKPGEQYPKERIAEINRIMTEESLAKSKAEQYTRIIVIADKLFANKAYEESKSQYQAALLLKPDETYPKQKIAELDKLLEVIAGEEALENQYNSIITSADRFLSEKSYSEAKAEYNKALSIKPEEEYPQKKINEIDNYFAALSEAKAKDEQYKQIIEQADKLFIEKNYEQSKGEYQNARSIKPDESYPKSKIAEIEQILADQAKQKSLEEQYNTLITEGDQKLNEKDYPEAKSKYLAALLVKPDQQYPKDKITGIDKILAELARKKSLDDQYNVLITKADKLFDSQSLDQAKAEYANALSIKPSESYPKERISEIDKMLADAAQLKALDEKYKSILQNADKLLAIKSYEPARSEYSNASAMKPGEQYPKDKIAEIDQILVSIADAKAREELYKSTIEKADKLLAEKSYNNARDEYSNALVIKPGESYPSAKITEIDKTLAEIAMQKSLDDQYTLLIAGGDKRLEEKAFEDAKKQYQSALQIKPSELYPKNKINEIDNILGELARLKKLDEQYNALIIKADQLFNTQSLDQAKEEFLNAGNLKPAEKYPKEKITEIDRLLTEAAQVKATNEKYQEILSNADKLFADKNYDQSKTEYNNASRVKPSEQYPKDKIIEIDKILTSIAEAKAKEEQYSASIQKADKLFLAKSYELAKSEYTGASLIKPEENYPKTKIAEIDKILSDIAKQKELDASYSAFIAEGDKKFSEKAYDEAKSQYQAATNLKPLEQYPRDRLAAIDQALTEIEKQKALDVQYQAKITEGDKLLGDKSYDQAKAAYLAAGKMKPSEQYPKEKVTEIDKALMALARQKSIDDQYKVILAKADKFLAERSYEFAKNEYINAGNIKPDEQYPKDKIAEIGSILAEMKAKDEAYKASITRADQLLLQKSYEEARNEYQNANGIKPNEQYPKLKIAEINDLLVALKGKKQTYDDLVKNADDLFDQKDYYKSKDLFQQASGIFPEENYPKQRLNRLNSMIDSIYRANKSLYDKAVADGDKYFNSLIYDKAIDAYSEASLFLPMERYPKEMISKIKKAIAENALVDVLKTSLIVTSGDEKQLPFEPTNPASRKNNYLYIKIKNLANKPINVLVRYGKDKTTSGGAVIKNLVADGNIYDRLISVRDQDPWYRVDNNWIGLLPQGGDIEVTFIQISRAAQ